MDKLRVLIVDDAPAIRAVLAAIVEQRLDATVECAVDATEALTLQERARYDVILSDLRMPGPDGLEFLTECARRWPDTTRILITAYADLDTAQRALNEGKVSRLLTKPVRAETLANEIRDALDHTRRRRDFEAAAARSRDLLGARDPTRK